MKTRVMSTKPAQLVLGSLMVLGLTGSTAFARGADSSGGEDPMPSDQPRSCEITLSYARVEGGSNVVGPVRSKRIRTRLPLNNVSETIRTRAPGGEDISVTVSIEGSRASIEVYPSQSESMYDLAKSSIGSIAGRGDFTLFAQAKVSSTSALMVNMRCASASTAPRR